MAPGPQAGCPSPSHHSQPPPHATCQASFGGTLLRLAPPPQPTLPQRFLPSNIGLWRSSCPAVLGWGGQGRLGGGGSGLSLCLPVQAWLPTPSPGVRGAPLSPVLSILCLVDPSNQVWYSQQHYSKPELLRSFFVCISHISIEHLTFHLANFKYFSALLNPNANSCLCARSFMVLNGPVPLRFF